MKNQLSTAEDRAFKSWVDAEAAYEEFQAERPENIILRQMSDDEFMAWCERYRGLRDALYFAQTTYYAAVRAAGREAGDYEARQDESWI